MRLSDFVTPRYELFQQVSQGPKFLCFRHKIKLYLYQYFYPVFELFRKFHR